jgi:hypothetical protein
MRICYQVRNQGLDVPTGGLKYHLGIFFLSTGSNVSNQMSHEKKLTFLLLSRVLIMPDISARCTS